MAHGPRVGKPRPIAMFSATLSSGKIAGSWWTKCRPDVRAQSGDRSATPTGSALPTWTVPGPESAV